MENIKNQIDFINNEISNFSEKEQKNFCEDCLEKAGNLKKYNPYLTDTGVCDLCGITDDLINVKIAQLVTSNKINIDDYHSNGGIRIFPKSNPNFKNGAKNSNEPLEFANPIQISFLNELIIKFENNQYPRQDIELLNQKFWKLFSYDEIDLYRVFF